MGEGKSRLVRFKEQHPHCCYCGGFAATESIDHAPPRAMFVEKMRAKGLEVPACNHCNTRFSAFDGFFSLLVLTMGSATHLSYEGRVASLVSSAARRFPTAVHEIVSNAQKSWLRRNGLLKPVVKIRFENSEIPFTVCYVTARIALALYYSMHNRPISNGAQVTVRWQTNVQPFPPDVLERLFGVLDDYVTLRQGNWDQSDQFECRFGGSEDGSTTGVALNFHQGVVQSLAFLEESPSRNDGGDDWLSFVVTEEGLTPLSQEWPRDIRVKKRALQ